MNRGVAYAALGQWTRPGAQAAFRDRVHSRHRGHWVGNNPALTVRSIARHCLQGEILARREQDRRGGGRLELAVAIEDGLRYNEAPDWLHPIRHVLGAVLVRAERYRQAEQVYRDDLTRNRENGWALNGLALCLRKQKAIQDAEEVETRFREAWAKADVKIRPLFLPGDLGSARPAAFLLCSAKRNGIVNQPLRPSVLPRPNTNTSPRALTAPDPGFRSPAEHSSPHLAVLAASPAR